MLDSLINKLFESFFDGLNAIWSPFIPYDYFRLPITRFLGQMPNYQPVSLDYTQALDQISPDGKFKLK